MTYDEIAQRALDDQSFREGLEAAARVARANRGPDDAPCPSGMIAVYLEQLARGEGAVRSLADSRDGHRRGGVLSPPGGSKGGRACEALVSEAVQAGAHEVGART